MLRSKKCFCITGPRTRERKQGFPISNPPSLSLAWKSLSNAGKKLCKKWDTAKSELYLMAVEVELLVDHTGDILVCFSWGFAAAGQIKFPYIYEASERRDSHSCSLISAHQNWFCKELQTATAVSKRYLRKKSSATKTMMAVNAGEDPNTMRGETCSFRVIRGRKMLIRLI